VGFLRANFHILLCVFPARHCERSEAIQSSSSGSPRRFAPRDDDEAYWLGVVQKKLMLTTVRHINPEPITFSVSDAWFDNFEGKEITLDDLRMFAAKG